MPEHRFVSADSIGTVVVVQTAIDGLSRSMSLPFSEAKRFVVGIVNALRKAEHLPPLADDGEVAFASVAGMIRETQVIRDFGELEGEETGDSKLPTILCLHCQTALGPLDVRISPSAAAKLGATLHSHELTRGAA
jgi:hypothetical protein